MKLRERLLLDTCAAIWLTAGAPMAPDAIARIEKAARRGKSLFVSAITAWEFAVLAERGRIEATMTPEAWFARLSELPGMDVAPLTPEILIFSRTLPEFDGKDPADRIIAATARALDLTVVTRDRPLLAYGNSGRIGVLTC
jgi:PIN domain nuclease of toxin-antitoxin system